MVFLWKLTWIEEVSSPLDFGKVSKMLWEPAFPLAPPFTLNQILEDMLRASVISFGTDWEKCLPFAEFA